MTIVGIISVVVYFYWYSKKIRMISVMEKKQQFIKCNYKWEILKR